MLGWNRSHISNEGGKPFLMLNEIQSDWAQMGRSVTGEALGIKDSNFPMPNEKFYQLSIVDAIDHAIKNNLDEVRIPINRESNHLYGTEGVTKFYESLGNKILPSVRNKLEKEGLSLTINKLSIGETWSIGSIVSS